MPDNILGGQGGTLLSAIVIVAVALLALFVVVWLYRNRSSSTFVRGGRARQPRLAVLDAAAVDTRRRIVLIRRDDVEHLVMIGGPTDVVIESRIVAADDAQAAADPDDSGYVLQDRSQSELARTAAPARDPAPRDPVAQDRIPHDMAQAVSPDQPRTTGAAQPVASAAAAPPPAPRSTPRPGAAPRPAPADTASAEPRTAPVPTSEPVSATSVAPMTAAAGLAATSLEHEAADVLDSARARVFQDPPMDQQQEPSAAMQPESPAEAAQGEPLPGERESAPAQDAPRPVSPLGYDEVLADAEPEPDSAEEWDLSSGQGSIADAQAVGPAPAAVPVPAPASTMQDAPEAASRNLRGGAADEAPMPNFEEVLAAELSGDLDLEDLDAPRRDGPAAHFEPATDAQRPQPAPAAAPVPSATAPEVQPETPPSQDSLEEEMARLLGDLTRKS